MSEEKDSEDGCGCMIIVILGILLLWYMLSEPRPNNAEVICAHQWHATPFCEALAERYRTKP